MTKAMPFVASNICKQLVLWLRQGFIVRIKRLPLSVKAVTGKPKSGQTSVGGACTGRLLSSGAVFANRTLAASAKCCIYEGFRQSEHRRKPLTLSKCGDFPLVGHDAEKVNGVQKRHTVLRELTGYVVDYIRPQPWHAELMQSHSPRTSLPSLSHMGQAQGLPGVGMPDGATGGISNAGLICWRGRILPCIPPCWKTKLLSALRKSGGRVYAIVSACSVGRMASFEPVALV